MATDQATLPSREELGRIARDTLDQTKYVIRTHVKEGATGDSTFYAKQLPALPALSPLETTIKYPVEVVNDDSFATARNLMDEHPDAIGRIAVLNLASDEEPGGGWLRYLTKTQV